MNDSEIPSSEDWGDISDPDVYEAYEFFFGKSNDSLQGEFKKNVIQRCSNLRWMPMKAFQYYIFGLKQYIESKDFGEFNKPDAVGCFFGLLEEKANTFPECLKVIYPKLRPLIDHIADNQLEFEADFDIYGDFKVKAKNISLVLDGKT